MRRTLLFISIWMIARLSAAQISPGDLAEAHAHLEGMSNCTQCHTIGSKISNDKCLACHTEIKSRVDARRGYHSSKQVYKKSCILCHSDHHGRQFQIVRFDKDKFDHTLTGYKLEGRHAEKKCADCHVQKNITDLKIKKKKRTTYLGLGQACLTCHEDYHQKTLPARCEQCHNFQAFKPAPGFDHEKARFRLRGKHTEVVCSDCHEVKMQNGKKFQQFTGLKFTSCANCHEDVHDNKFGQNCADCHTEQSFKAIKNTGGFNHDLTNFKLEGRHKTVTCKDCHKASVTAPLKHDKCTDCHADYHKGDFTRQGVITDCSKCHTVDGFTPSQFTLEQHNQGAFALEGAHLATPCIACHKKSVNWKFKNIGSRCADCHTDIHKEYLDKKYYPEANCMQCHSVESWQQISFDHTKTGFPLEGKHKEPSCRSCHKSNAGQIAFSGTGSACVQCHEDEHNGQFMVNNTINCRSCHTPEGWKAGTFDHNTARFKLDGKHKDVPCAKCHPTIIEKAKEYVLYKTGKITCADCHS